MGRLKHIRLERREVKTAVIGTGRCGTEAISRWIQGALFEREHPNLASWTSDEDAEKIIGRMKADVIVDHRLALFIPIVEMVWPGCKYLVLRRERESTIRSMDRWNWYREDSHLMRTRHRPPDESLSHFDKCTWYHDFILKRMLRGLALVGLDRQRQVYIETIDQQRTELAKWLGRKELAKKPIDRTHGSGKNRTVPQLNGELSRLNRPKFFCMGAQFSIARWLRRQLCNHPTVRGPIPAVGESDDFSVATHFFSDDQRMALGLNEYASRFSDEPGLIQGDFTPIYAFLNEARIEKIVSMFPDLTAIMILDHPVRRLWTLIVEQLKHWHGKIWSRRIFEPTSRDEMIYLITAPWNAERSDYDVALHRWERALGSQRVLIIFREELIKHPKYALRQIFDHLALTDTTSSRIVESAPNLLAGPFVTPPQEYSYIIHGVIEKQTERLIHRFGDRVAHWSRCDYNPF